jgi:murein DD-endopeptidase MepM/ murein hydrolase activator NlpD
MTLNPRHHASRRFPLLGLLASLGLSVPAGAAGAEPAFSSELRPDGNGGGEYSQREQFPHLTDKQREEIWGELRRNIQKLEREGALPSASLAYTKLAWPLRAANGLTDPGFHGVSNFVDQHASYPGYVLDWNCGARSYDTSAGYNHKGTDIFLWPFPWLKMDTAQVQVVSAAPGTIVGRTDGNYDRNCSFNSGTWNAVYVRHADGSIAWYGHLKNGSVTAKAVGQTVVQGEYLGTVGSSGNSTGPHLHLEVYDSTGNLNDPYQGACNTKNGGSWWLTQPPYNDSTLNHLGTGYAAPSFPACPSQESPNERTAFRFGQTVYFTVYYRDQLSTQTGQYRIYRPDGSLYSSWTHNSPASYVSSYWYWYFNNFAPTGPSGTWRFEVTFNGRTNSHSFTLSP